jgi:hypothetical protein
MKKKEVKILIILAAAAAGVILILKLIQANTHSGVKVAIYYRDEIVQEFWSDEDAVYHVDGDYGGLDVEVKDGKWHVTNEECPNHICHEMGWVGAGEYLPITCLPNNVVVVQESD